MKGCLDILDRQNTVVKYNACRRSKTMETALKGKIAPSYALTQNAVE
jgi:hypothetical protein